MHKVFNRIYEGTNKYTEEEEEELIKEILKQGPEKDNDIDFSTIKNEKSVEENLEKFNHVKLIYEVR